MTVEPHSPSSASGQTPPASWMSCAPWPRQALRIAWIIIVIGMVFRTVAYLHNRSLRQDESMLAVSIVDRTWSGLLQPLASGQRAPVGFLLAEKLAVTCLGRNEYALRLPPLAAGFACLILGLALARRVLAPSPGLLMLAMLAVAKPLLFYASDAKPYSLDAAVAMWITWTSLRLFRHGMRAWDLALWTSAGTAGVWFSYPAVFVFAGSAITIVLLGFRTRRRWPAAAAGAVCVGASFLFHYAFFAPVLHAEAPVMAFWAEGFPPRSVGAALLWTAWSFLRTCEIPFGGSTFWLTAPLVLTGIWTFWRRDRILLALLGSPVLFALTASVLRKYPFANRMLVFLVPALVLLIAAGLAWIAAAVGSRWRLLVPLLVAVLLGERAASAVIQLVVPERTQDMKTVLARMESVRKPDDAIAVCCGSWAAFQFYAPKYRLDRGRPAVEIPLEAESAILQASVKQFPGGTRVWLVYATRAKHHAIHERVIREALSSRGRELAQYEGKGSLAVLYELNR